MVKRAAKKTDRCIVAGCENEKARRGLCEGCYRAAWRRVKEGITTWARLESAGLAEPLEAHGTPFSTEFAKSGALLPTAKARG